ncbi:MAG: hypothetical protein AAF485_27475 [Chloroflexota bacterium]
MNQQLQVRETPKSRKALESLQKEASSSQKYVRVRQLIDSKDYTSARKRLVEDFLATENHDYRDVASLFSRVVEAEQRQGKIPLHRRYSAFLNISVITIIIMIMLTSYLLGLVSANYIDLRQVLTADPYIPAGIIAAIWIGGLLLFFFSRRKKL